MFGCIVFISSCNPHGTKQGKLCQRDEDEPERLCTNEELAFISNWNYVISTINNFNIDDFDKYYKRVGNDYINPRLALLGEVHIDFHGMLTNYSYLNYLAKNQKVQALKEGCNFDPNPKKVESENKKQFSHVLEIIVLILQKELIDEGRAYDPRQWDKLAAARVEPRKEYFLAHVNILYSPVLKIFLM